MAEEVEEQSPRPHRWLVLLALLGATAWFLRSRRAAAVDLGDPWPFPRSAPPPGGGPVAAGAPAAAPVRAASTASARSASAPAAPPRSAKTRHSAKPEPEPLSGSAAPLLDGSAPGPEYTIKGNTRSMLFHPPTSPYYKRTRAGIWFRTADDARAAGFTEWIPKKRTTG